MVMNMVDMVHDRAPVMDGKTRGDQGEGILDRAFWFGDQYT